MSERASEQDELIQQILERGPDDTHDRERAKDPTTSLDHLSGELIQTRFQMDKASRAALRAATRLRRAIMMYTAVLSFVMVTYVVGAFSPPFVSTASDARTWVRWHQVGGTWNPLSAWPTKKECEAAAPRERPALLDPASRCLPDSVDPRVAEGEVKAKRPRDVPPAK
jgi:hypothetical protein